MTEIQAILGMSQLKRLEEFINHRNKIANIYKKKLKSLVSKGLINFREYPDNIHNSYWKFLININKELRRREIKEKLEKFGIKIDWPYQPLIHLQPVFIKMYGTKEGQLAKSEEYAKHHICLPTHLGIEGKDARYIAKKFLEVLS